jgi:two-component system phosphate regulon response regulator PhoB
VNIGRGGHHEVERCRGLLQPRWRTSQRQQKKIFIPSKNHRPKAVFEWLNCKASGAASGEGVQRYRNVFVTDAELTRRREDRQLPCVTEPSALAERVLVVDDEPDIVALVAYHLAKSGYSVSTATSGTEGLAVARRDKPSLIILDLMLPGLSGLEVMEELRGDASTSRIAVLMLTARREESDRIKGLTLGADDYLTKPFSPQELVLRVAAILRRVKSSRGESEDVKQVGPLRIETTAHRVTVDGREIDLTPTEFKLLLLLAERKGRVQPRNLLLEIVWEAAPDIQTRTVDMHVQRLRAKLGPAGDLIETVRGFGYRIRNVSERS